MSLFGISTAFFPQGAQHFSHYVIVSVSWLDHLCMTVDLCPVYTVYIPAVLQIPPYSNYSRCFGVNKWIVLLYSIKGHCFPVILYKCVETGKIIKIENIHENSRYMTMQLITLSKNRIRQQFQGILGTRESMLMQYQLNSS